MIARGDIYYGDLGTRYLCEQGGVRPVVILQNDKGNAFGPTTIIAPITSQSKNKRVLPTHMLIQCRHLPENSWIVFDQSRALDICRLSDYICHMRKEDIKQMDLIIGVSLGLKGSKSYEL